MEKIAGVVSVESDLTTRYKAMLAWVESLLGEARIEALAGDLSYRRYFRVFVADQTLILMDAPVEVESSQPFVRIAYAFFKLGVRTPRILHQDLDRGFLLLEDFGDQLYLSALNDKSADMLYKCALDSLSLIAQCGVVEGYSLPVFSRQTYWAELAWFEQWYLTHYVKVTLSSNQKQQLHAMFDVVIECGLSQPQVSVHKDFHSRNLLLLSEGGVGVIDFQDALIGPVAYDVMSLMYDHYIEWPYERIRQWVRYYHQALLRTGVLVDDDFDEFMRWHDWLAVQRIMKNLGNFVRAHAALHKSSYLKDIPRIYRYLLEITARYDALTPLASLLRLWRPEELR